MKVTYRWIRCFDKDFVAVTVRLVFLNGARNVAVFACVWIVKRERYINASDVAVHKHLETTRIFT